MLLPRVHVGLLYFASLGIGIIACGSREDISDGESESFDDGQAGIGGSVDEAGGAPDGQEQPPATNGGRNQGQFSDVGGGALNGGQGGDNVRPGGSGAGTAAFGAGGTAGRGNGLGAGGVSGRGIPTGPGSNDTGPGSNDTGPGSNDSGPGNDDSGPGSDDSGPGSDDSGPGNNDSGPGSGARGGQ